jgi:mevalonate kinase
MARAQTQPAPKPTKPSPASGRFTTFAPGKVILLGEHAVVYGHPALAAPLSRGVTAHAAPAKKVSLALPPTLKGKGRKLLQTAFARAAAASGNPPVRVSLESDLPVSMGLGSSAAVAVATSRALLTAAGRSTDVRQVLTVALEMEREFHATPSGLDHTCSAYGALIRFQRKASAEHGRVQVVESSGPLSLLIVLAGKRSPTHETVAGLRERFELWPTRYRRVMADIGKLADEGAQAISRGEWEALGDAMNVNHGLLSGLGLSSAPIDGLVHMLRGMGALGAKLTGAGGDGGAVIALFRVPERLIAERLLARSGIPCFESQIAGPVAP